MSLEGEAAAADKIAYDSVNGGASCNGNGEGELLGGKEEKADVDPDLFGCLLQPAGADADPDYVGIRRLLLHRKAEAGLHRRLDWRCNGKGYVSYRNFIRRPRNWETVQSPSHQSTPGNSGRWLSSSSPLSHLYEVDSWTSSRDLRSGTLASIHRNSFSSTASDSDRPRSRGVEPAYSFVGMHCIFYQCKAAVWAHEL